MAVGSGGVWKTRNAGTTWDAVFDDQGSYSIGALALDPSNPNTVWVGTGENVGGRHVGYGDGVYRSLDGGATWKNMGLPDWVFPFALVLLVIGLPIILATASFFVDIDIAHPVVMALFLVLTSVSFSLFGFILGIWADGWEKLTIVPILVIMPLTFLGGTFYSISMLPPAWQTISLFNPVVYLVSGFRWSFYEIADVNLGVSLGMTLLFLMACLIAVWWIFRTGYRLKS